MVIRSWALLGAMAACAFLFAAPTARAVDITVDNAGDTGDAVPGDGTCGSAVPSSCTVRAAITEANANGQTSNRILFSVAGPTTALSDLPALTKPLEIDGGASGYTVNGNDLFRLLQMPSTASAGAYSFKKLTLIGGRTTAAGGGGGVYFAPTAQASLTLTDVEIASSTATAGPGGGLAVELLANGSSMTLLRVNINGNAASADGGGLWVRLGGTGSLSLDDSIIDGNTAGSILGGGGNGSGGGIDVRRGRLNVGNTTISNNTASGTGQGGGIYLENDGSIGGSVRLDNSTVSGNTADGIAVGSGNPAASWVTFTTITNNLGVGIRAAVPATSFPGNVSNPFTSNIVAGNATNCSTAFAHSDTTNSGYNLTDGATCGFTQGTDKVVALPSDLGLAVLGDNPVPPQTHALAAGSPAIDAGNPAWDTGADQRGADTQDGGADGTPGDSTAVRDIGAYEFGGFGLVQFGFTTGANFDAPEDITPAAISIKRYGTGTAATSAPTAAFSTTAFASTTQGPCGTAGNDYTELSSSPVDFSFTATPGLNQFDQTASIPICNDQVVESTTEGFDIALAKPAGETVGYDLGPKASGTVTILDRENGVFQFDNTAAYEANEGNSGSSGSITLTILRTAGTAGAVRVTYSTTSTCGTCTAAAGTDYETVTNGTVDFAAGDASKTVTINFVGDGAFEDDGSGAGGEIFRVDLSADPACLNLQPGQSCEARRIGANGDPGRSALVNIKNDDTAQPGQFLFSASGYTGLEASGSVTITVQRVGGSDGDVSVVCGAADGTGSGAATVTTDFLAPANGNPDPLEPCLLAWSDADSTDKTFSVSLVNDSATESNKTFSVTLTAPSAGMGGAGGVSPTIGTPSATVTLVSDEQPQFVFSDTDVTLSEGSPAQLTLQWNAFTGGDVTVPYYTVDGTATSPIDYTGIPQGTPTVRTITSAAATSLALSDIPTVPDGPEGNETFTVQLGTLGNGGQLGTDNPATPGVTEGPTATVTIRDPASVRFTAASFTRADEANSGTIALTVRRQGDISASMDVDFAISQNCATPPCATESVDYTRPGGFTGTLHWNANVTTDQPITVTVIGDTAIEGDESLQVTLSNARTNGATPADIGTPGSAAAVIPDDDYRFEVVETSPLTVAENVGNATITVRRFGSSVGTASVGFASADGTALAGQDYTQTASPPALSWAAGEGGTKTISVPITDDAPDESTENFTVALSSPSNNASGEATAITGSPLTVNITDNDAVTVAFSAAAQSIGEAGGTVTVTAVRTGATTFSIDVPFTVSGSAANPSDHDAVSGTITIAAAASSGTYTFSVAGDAIDEANETVVFTMGTPTGGDVTAAAPTTHTVTIIDDDAVTVAFSAAAQTVGENVGAVTVTATRTGATTFAIGVPFTVSGSAANPADHNAVSGTIAIPAASASGSYTFTVANDALDEPAETVVFTMGTPTGGDVTAVAPTTHTVTVTDNDAVTVAFSAAAQTVGEKVGTVTVTATRTGATTSAINVPFTVSGTAVNPADHNAASGAITIPAASASGTYTFTAVADAVDEANETVIFTMGTPTGGDVTAAAPSTHTVTITDSVTVGEDTPGVVVTPSGSVGATSGGGGAFSWTALLALAGLAGLRRRGLVVALALFSTGALAQTAPAPKSKPRLSYNSMDLSYLQVKVDDPSVDAGGFSLAGSWATGKNLFVTAGYSSIETDNLRIAGTVGSTQTDTIAGGLGWHRAINPRADMVAAVSVLLASADGQGGFSGSSDDTGYGFEAGVRSLWGPLLEWNASVSYVSIFGDSDTALSVRTLYGFTPRFGVLAGVGLGSNASQLNVGVRYTF